MSKEDLIRMFPVKRISPSDGLAITAEVWGEAHSYHRQRQQLHALFDHGPGILTGLEVIASDPPDSSVYVRPGIAMDPLGQIIVLREPVAYDIGEAHGLLYLLLTYGESRPRAESDQEESARYIHAQFGIEAALDVPGPACVELARIRRQDRDSPITDAQDAAHPGANEIDQRFRRQVGAVPRQEASIAVCGLGGAANAQHARGMSHLASTLRRLGPTPAWVDTGVPLGAGLEAYTLVYLVAHDEFQLGQSDMQTLYGYLQAGGTLFIESCRRDQPDGDPPSDASFADLFRSLGVQLAPLPPEHSLLAEPYLFSTPPAGFETDGAPGLSIGGLPEDEGVIFGTMDYGCLWQGERRGRTASREEIRAALEWGSNVIAYALARRVESGR